MTKGGTMRSKLVGVALVLLLVAMICWSSTPAQAQAVYGSIIGTVTDSSGAAVPNATVTVTDVRKGTKDSVTTNESGNYSVTHLIPDVYEVRVEAAGFKVSEFKNISVSADTASRVDGQMQVGGSTESVEVTAEAAQLKTDRSDVATQFNERYVENLPVLNRNFTSFELLSPGTQKLVGWGHAATENPQGSQQIFVNGQHFSGTGFELDGTDNQDPILGIIVVNPNLDAITETKIALQNYDAEFGKAVAGLVTVQTKSGSNALHGSGFWYRRTDATEARDPFTQYQADPITHRFIPKDRWNNFGGSIGGPIIKDKLFFFGDYQGTRQASGVTNQLTIPTSQVTSTCIGGGDGSGYCKLDQYTTLFGNGKWTPGSQPDPSTLLYNPTSGTIDAKGNPVGRTPFCGPAGCATQPNWIPLSMIPAPVQNLLQMFPAPTSSALQNNFIASGNGPYAQNAMDTRIDYTKSQSLNFFGRFSLARFALSGPGSLGALGGVGLGPLGLAGSSVTHNYSLASGFDKIFSTTLLTDFRFGWFKYNPTTHKPDEGKPAAQTVGIPNVNFGDVFTSGLPSFQGNGPNGAVGVINNFGDGLNVGRCNCPLTESEQQFQFVNNWTKLHGNHQIKWGADIRYAMNLRIPSDADRAGVMNFDSGTTSDAGVGGNAFGSFLLGDVKSMNRFVSTSLNAAERQKRWFFYGQDTWRVTPKLTLNYGLRWEIYFPESVNEKGNGGFANPVEGIIRIGGYGPYGLNGNIDNNLHAFAPRLGIAYQITEKTVVRMGYGRSFDMGVFGSNFGHTVTQNLPVLVNQGVSASNNTVNNGLPSGVNDSYFPAFNLSQGPPVYTFPAIPTNGVLPLGGPGNNVQPRMRPTSQTLPTLDAWNVTVQRQITKTMTAEVAYVANKGTHVFAGNGPAYDANQPAYGAGSAIVTAAGTAPNFSPNVPLDQRRPYYGAFTYPGYIDPSTGLPMVCCNNGVVMGNYFGNNGNSHYNALQVKVDKRFSNGLQFMSNYTWSHAYNYTNDNNFQYSGDRKLTYGRDDMNRNHVFIFNSTYDLPFGRGRSFGRNVNTPLDYIIGGWQLSNTTNWSSGLPWTANAGECGLVTDTGPCLPNISGSFNVGAGSFDPISHTVTYFTPVAGLAYPTSALTPGTDTCSLDRPSAGPFSLPACGTPGNVGRNTFTGPHHFTDDMSIAKNFRLTERFTGQFRMDAYNVFNHPVYGFSSQDYGATGGTCIDCSGTNGKIKDIENGTTMRQLTFAVRVSF
jgi:carboxypeptidase family protein/TonB-dependent receptor-like protein